MFAAPRPKTVHEDETTDQNYLDYAHPRAVGTAPLRKHNHSSPRRVVMLLHTRNGD